MAEEANTTSAGDNRACSDGGSREDECDSSEGNRTRDGIEHKGFHKKGLLCNGSRCYACGGFKHMARHCRNRGQRERVAEGRRLEYGRGGIEGNFEHSDNLKGMENLESLD